MNEQLEQKLIQKYPKLLRQTEESEMVSPMYWGIACGDGWYNILNTMMNGIQRYVDRKQKENPDFPQVEFSQIKEKFGGLRVYIDNSDEVIDAYINFAESMANVTCEICGNVGKTRSYNGWYATDCDGCFAKHKAQTKTKEDSVQDQ